MKAKTFNNTPSRSLRGFTLVELLVVITIIVVMAAIGFPAISSMRATAHRSECMSKLRQWGIAMGGYAADNSGKVTQSKWASMGSGDPSPYLIYWTGGSEIDTATRRIHVDLRHCPAVKESPNSPTYAMIRPNPLVSNSAEFSLASIQDPSRFMLMVEATPNSGLVLSNSGQFTTWVQPLTVDGPRLRHKYLVNALLGDFSVKSLSWTEIQKGLKLGHWINLEPPAGGGR